MEIKTTFALAALVLTAPLLATTLSHAQGGSSNPAGATTAPGAQSNTSITPATAPSSRAFFSGSYQATGNVSLLGIASTSPTLSKPARLTRGSNITWMGLTTPTRQACRETTSTNPNSRAR